MKKTISNQQLTINNRLFIFCDGGARGNPGPAAIGFIIKNSRGEVLVEKGKYIGRATNNQAEYQAVIAALKWIINHQSSTISSKGRSTFGRNHQSSINFFLDSQLVVNQLNGLYKIKNAKLRDLVIQARGLENQIKTDVFYQHISRDKNTQPDRLLNQALDDFLNYRKKTKKAVR